MMNQLQNARALVERGLRQFPIVSGLKVPAVRFTQEATTDPAKIESWFGDGGRYAKANIGVATDGLIVLDLDTKANGPANMFKLSQASHKMPSTFTVRTASDGYHLYFRLPESADPSQYGGGVHLFADELKAAGVEIGEDGKTGIDTRSFHNYVVAPGSRIGGKSYRIAEERDIPIAEAPQWLLDAARRSKAGGGVRRDTAELTHANVDVDQAIARVQALQYLKTAPASVKGAGGDETAFKVAAQLRDLGCTYDTACELMRSEHWGNGYGWSGKLETKPIRNAYVYGQNSAGAKVTTAADFPAGESVGTPGRERAAVQWIEDQVHVIRPKVAQLIQADDEPGKVMQRGGELVTVAYAEQTGVVRDEGNAPLLVPLAVPYTFSTIRERVTASVQIFKVLANEKQKGQRRELACPELLARLLLESQPKSAPVLGAILDTPLVRIDGALLGHEGFDPVTRTYGAFRGRDFLPVPERPTRAQTAAAYKALVEEGFADVLFASPEDAAVMVAAVLTMIQRPLLSEAMAFYTSAPAGGTGKTECNRIAGYIGTGQRLGVTDWPGGQDSEYQANTLLHDLARQGARVVLFDNVADGATIKSAALEAAITGGTIARRTVGHSEVIAHPFTGTVLMNGNNLQFDTEGVRRRFLHCALNSDLEHPAERAFRRADLQSWLQANRMRMVQAALTMLRAARVARVEPTYTLGFPEWARYVVAALEYAGAPSIERKLVRDSVPNEADNALRGVLCAWHAAFGKYPRRLAEVLAWTGEDPTRTDERVAALHEAIAAFAEERFERVTPIALSRKLRSVRGRLAGGFRLAGEADRNGVERWKVQAVEQLRAVPAGMESLL